VQYYHEYKLNKEKIFEEDNDSWHFAGKQKNSCDSSEYAWLSDTRSLLVQRVGGKPYS
jgi:hypothetical protein